MEQSKVLSYLARPSSVFLLLFILLAADRLNTLLQFHFVFTGNDDLIFWQAARDYSRGIFHEPYFYGQDYNPMLEALLAVPLLWLKVPYPVALPLVSAFVALFPFVLFAFVLFRCGNTLASLIFLLIPQALPPEYAMISGMTRGFTSGLFFTGFLVFVFTAPSKRSSWVLLSAGSALAVFANPNALVFIIPFLVFLLIRHYKSTTFYFSVLSAAALYTVLDHFGSSFYELHPEHNIHPGWKLDYSFERMIQSFSGLDEHFSFLTPFLWPVGWLSLFLFPAAGIYLAGKRWAAALSLIAAFLFVIACLGINKVHDHLNTIQLSGSRMFLGLPLFLCLACAWLAEERDLPFRKVAPFMIGLSLTLFFVRIHTLKSSIVRHTGKTDQNAVLIKKVEEVRCDCAELKKLTGALKPEIIVFVPNFLMQTAEMEFLSYACPLLEEDLPPTFLPAYEKRTWVYQGEREKVHSSILVYGLDPTIVKRVPDLETISGDPPVYYLKNNSLPLAEALRGINYEFSR